MKFNVFQLTKNEQRVVILLLMVLLAAAFVRYWHNVQAWPPNRTEATASATPISLSEEETQPDSEDSATKLASPSPQSSP